MIEYHFTELSPVPAYAATRGEDTVIVLNPSMGRSVEEREVIGEYVADHLRDRVLAEQTYDVVQHIDQLLAQRARRFEMQQRRDVAQARIDATRAMLGIVMRPQGPRITV